MVNTGITIQEVCDGGRYYCSIMHLNPLKPNVPPKGHFQIVNKTCIDTFGTKIFT